MNMVKKAAGQIVMFTVVSAIFFSIVLSFFAGSLIDAMFADADICVKNKATEYLIGCAISCIFLSLYMGCVAVFRGIGQTKICLKLSMIINLIHLFASFIFINILRLDIIGTSLSLNLARVIGGGVSVRGKEWAEYPIKGYYADKRKYFNLSNSDQYPFCNGAIVF